MIGALKDKYSLPKLLKRLHLSRSSYYYQMSVMKVNEKHESLRIHIKEIFHNNHGTYGYCGIIPKIDTKADIKTGFFKPLRKTAASAE